MRIVISFSISFENRNADTKKALNINSTSNFLHYVCYEYPASDPSLFRIAAGAGALFLSNGGKIEEGDCGEPYDSLQYDFNRDSCPQAEGRIRAMVWYLRKSRSGVAPAFLRLVFRDCSIEGCDSSVLLDEADGVDSEKMSLPSESLNRFYVINIIKEDLEEICPGVVSYSDTLPLAAREGVVLAGGPFYPLHTGRRDSRLALADIATFELPLPNADLPETLASFASRGFDLRETVTFLDAHGIGVIHCIFFKSHLCNLGRINESLDPGFLNLLRSKCRNVHSGSAVLVNCRLRTQIL
ncbi:putative peroxidase 48 [Citrus sinensis]|uniref:Peroxidase 48 n=1 Tax=Citrus sinensis TaxID=2711 RepID=A0ACB8JC36_CITSI|nr:putative peroxidase 48 [Citrus sinensis]